MIDQTVNGYTIQRLLGEGGMADVYYAVNQSGSTCAIKVLKSRFADAEGRDRFENEAALMLRIKHPNIPIIYELAEVQGSPAIIMEYLEGQTLDEMVRKATGAIDERSLITWFQQIAQALQFAHSQGIIHRDIKPSNIFVTKTGQVKILDFGIAKAKGDITRTITGQVLGTFMYMSPEQVVDVKRVNQQTDVYSLGVTFYHLLTGKAPYSGLSNVSQVLQKILKEDLPVSNLPHPWSRVLSSCLAKDPSKRNLSKALQYLLSVETEAKQQKQKVDTTSVPPQNRGSKIKNSGIDNGDAWFWIASLAVTIVGNLFVLIFT